MKREKGARQGCILSPTLFSLYAEELAARMRRIHAKVSEGIDKTSVILYADVVAVMRESADKLQCLLEAVDWYGKDFGIRFNSEKGK